MGLSNKDLEVFVRGTRLHDVGKIAIPDRVVLKPGRLNPEERVVMEGHIAYGVRFVSPFLELTSSCGVIGGHHEKWDGGGYPSGLQGDAIPWGGRYFAVIDVFDALRSRRPYKEPFPWTRPSQFRGRSRQAFRAARSAGVRGEY